MGIYDKRLKLMQDMRQRNIERIIELEYSGYQISTKLKNILTRPLTKKRYSRQEYLRYREFSDMRNLKRNAYKEYRYKPYMSHADISYNRTARTVKMHYGHEIDDLAKTLFKDMKYALSKHPNRETGKMVKYILKDVGYKQLGSSLNILKRLYQINEKDFIRSFKRTYSKNDGEKAGLMNLSQHFYLLGNATEQIYQEKKNITELAAHKTFFENREREYNQDIDYGVLDDYFKHSVEWSRFRKLYKPSDEIILDEHIDKMEEIVKELEKKGDSPKSYRARLDAIFSDSTTTNNNLVDRLDNLLKQIMVEN